MSASPRHLSLDDRDIHSRSSDSSSPASARAERPRPSLVCVSAVGNATHATGTLDNPLARTERAQLERAKRLVAHGLLRGAGLLFIVSLPVFMLWLDVQWLGNSVGEISATELSQLTFIALSAISFGTLARFSTEDRRFATLAAGFFACMLIRELDAVLDLIIDGLWQALAISVALTCIAYAAADWRATLRGMARLLASRYGLALTIALALLLAYSRLLGMTALWQGLLDDGYVRVFKNAVEESAELLSYTLVVAASIAYVATRARR
jgi:hypothetical protein